MIDIRILEDDIGTLASEFQSHFFQVTVTGSFHDGATDKGGAGKGDLFDLEMGRDGCSDGGTISVNDIDDTGRETGFFDQRADSEGSQGSEFGAGCK